MNVYNVTTVVRLSASFTDGSGTPADPSTVVLTVTPPDQPTAPVTPVHDGTGQFHYDLTVNLPGIWQYQWQGSGSLVVASAVFNLRGE